MDRTIAVLLFAVALSACAAPDRHVPDFARRPYEAFSRQAVVSIASREWRLFGQPIQDDPSASATCFDDTCKLERREGLWQRIGEYWWIGLNADRRERSWTGKHAAGGIVFAPERDGAFAWSAAFISYVMRTAGAGPRFPYSASHADYINEARMASVRRDTTAILWAERPNLYAPKPGDLICYGREGDRFPGFDDLPAARFASHCDIVTGLESDRLSAIGGNVNDAVALKRVPLTPAGTIAGADDTPIDSRYAWFVVIRVIYGDEPQ
ncbi:MAG TPA: DUF2272 domain-containing protein [Alphaproteobacteria bacterium]|nr:DUF2272 domain-containing protein [Alphaproteobacteria bacterium]